MEVRGKRAKVGQLTIWTKKVTVELAALWIPPPPGESGPIFFGPVLAWGGASEPALPPDGRDFPCFLRMLA